MGCILLCIWLTDVYLAEHFDRPNNGSKQPNQDSIVDLMGDISILLSALVFNYNVDLETQA